MDTASHNVGAPAEPGQSHRFNLSGARWRALLLAIALGAAFFLVFWTHLLPAHSDDGPGVDETAFDSPILIWKYPFGDKGLLSTSKSTAGDLLTNGDMDQIGFYWRFPNHWIAGAWFEWFATSLRIPEFNDGNERGFVHTPYSSQRLQLWGASYAGGLMQSTVVTPCTYYQFQAYGQSRPGADDPPPVDVASHMKVGIEPYGWKSGRSIYDDYDPRVELGEFPATIVWSPEATHNFVFAPYTVTAEALSSAVTVILFSNPETDFENGVWWNDTIWDTASLVEVPPPSGTILDGSPRERDGLITNLSVTALPGLAVVSWRTSVDASAQVLYRVVEPFHPVSTTQPFSFSLYLPMVAGQIGLADLTEYSLPDTTPTRHHQIVLAGLPNDYILDFVALSRRLEGQSCVTSASSVIHAVSSGEANLVYLPALLRRE